MNNLYTNKELLKELKERVINQKITIVQLKEIEKLAREKELEKAYREAWNNPQRYQEAKQWETATVNDWSERNKKNKK